MFKACYYIKWDDVSHCDKFKLIDDDFECLFTVAPSFLLTEIMIGVIKEYKKRKLNIGLNLALATIWYAHHDNMQLNYLITSKNYISNHTKHIKNWKKYSKERNQYLKKILAWV